MRILSMDIGDKRIGMAVSDAMGWTAQGILTLERRSMNSDMEQIERIINKYQVERIVIGLPKNMDGTIGLQGEKIKVFAESLRKRFSKEIVFWDERLTTVSAHKVMLEADLSRKKRKERVDQIAAVLILQSYLDYLNYLNGK
ncbi:MAG: Holliday junction resolvase RuvX [Caldicoprobacterales bacterium]|nr:Holliday junction resolvase RuvX [Clostridiales bacterium]